MIVTDSNPPLISKKIEYFTKRVKDFISKKFLV